MKSIQMLVDYDAGRQFNLVLDSKKLSIELAGTESLDFKATYPTLAAMEKGYRQRVAPYLKKCQPYDIELKEEVKPITDLAAYFEELATVGGRGNERSDRKRTLEQEVAGTVKTLRIQLNKACGAKKTKLDVAVFWIDAFKFPGIYVNPKGITSTMNDKELDKALGKLDDKAFRRAAIDLEMAPLGGEALEPYGDYTNPDSWCRKQLLHLALARLEAKPGLRANVTPTKGCRFLLQNPSWDLAAKAKKLITQPAEKFFKATRER